MTVFFSLLLPTSVLASMAGFLNARATGGLAETAILVTSLVPLGIAMLQHVNLPLRHGWLNYVFSTNTLHRWHHSAERGEGDTNFGSTLVLWDQVFSMFRPSCCQA
jgi:sterol desaturase/sphingolipid hydroxylase (fatty acid hydroxylase superfamily)